MYSVIVMFCIEWCFEENVIFNISVENLGNLWDVGNIVMDYNMVIRYCWKFFKSS